jgi:hypothetical protein
MVFKSSKSPHVERRVVKESDEPVNDSLRDVPRISRRRVRPLRDEPAVVPRGMPLRIYVSTRWFSALLVVILLIVLFLFVTRDNFFIRVIFVGGTRYLTTAEIFQRSNLANMHIFWVDPEAVEQQLEVDPAIANAQVEIGWPPNMVQIIITEREPALIWEQSGQRVWVDVNGRVMQLRRDIPNLVRVIVQNPSRNPNFGACPLQGMDEVLGPGSCIDPLTVEGALQFKALYPSVQELVYDPSREKGLGFLDGNGWVLWFGDGTDLELKMRVNDSIVNEFFRNQGRRFIEINVANPDKPFISLAP